MRIFNDGKKIIYLNGVNEFYDFYYTKGILTSYINNCLLVFSIKFLKSHYKDFKTIYRIVSINKDIIQNSFKFKYSIFSISKKNKNSDTVIHIKNIGNISPKEFIKLYIFLTFFMKERINREKIFFQVYDYESIDKNIPYEKRIESYENYIRYIKSRYKRIISVLNIDCMFFSSKFYDYLIKNFKYIKYNDRTNFFINERK